MNYSGKVIYRTMLAMKVAFIGKNNRTEYRGFLSKKNSFRAKGCKSYE
jgi:hypothetical protein